MELNNPVIENKALYQAYHKEFKQIFDLPLSKFLDPQNIVHLLCGFDIVGFDKELDTPVEVSMTEYIAKIYGKRGVGIIEKLIGFSAVK